MTVNFNYKLSGKTKVVEIKYSHLLSRYLRLRFNCVGYHNTGIFIQ